jgi:hypothetical protein
MRICGDVLPFPLILAHPRPQSRLSKLEDLCCDLVTVSGTICTQRVLSESCLKKGTHLLVTSFVHPLKRDVF